MKQPNYTPLIILYCSVACADCWYWPAQLDSFYAAILSLLHHCCAIPMLMSQQANQKDGRQCLQSYSNILHIPNSTALSARAYFLNKEFHVIMLYDAFQLINCSNLVRCTQSVWQVDVPKICLNNAEKCHPFMCPGLALAIWWHRNSSSKRNLHWLILLFSKKTSKHCCLNNEHELYWAILHWQPNTNDTDEVNESIGKYAALVCVGSVSWKDPMLDIEMVLIWQISSKCYVLSITMHMPK